MEYSHYIHYDDIAGQSGSSTINFWNTFMEHVSAPYEVCKPAIYTQMGPSQLANLVWHGWWKKTDKMMIKVAGSGKVTWRSMYI